MFQGQAFLGGSIIVASSSPDRLPLHQEPVIVSFKALVKRGGRFCKGLNPRSRNDSSSPPAYPGNVCLATGKYGKS